MFFFSLTKSCFSVNLCHDVLQVLLEGKALHKHHWRLHHNSDRIWALSHLQPQETSPHCNWSRSGVFPHLRWPIRRVWWSCKDPENFICVISFCPVKKHKTLCIFSRLCTWPWAVSWSTWKCMNTWRAITLMPGSRSEQHPKNKFQINLTSSSGSICGNVRKRSSWTWLTGWPAWSGGNAQYGRARLCGGCWNSHSGCCGQETGGVVVHIGTVASNMADRVKGQSAPQDSLIGSSTLTICFVILDHKPSWSFWTLWRKESSAHHGMSTFVQN